MLISKNSQYLSSSNIKIDRHKVIKDIRIKSDEFRMQLKRVKGWLKYMIIRKIIEKLRDEYEAAQYRKL